MASGFTLADAQEVPELEAMRAREASLDGLMVAPEGSLSTVREVKLSGAAVVAAVARRRGARVVAVSGAAGADRPGGADLVV